MFLALFLALHVPTAHAADYALHVARPPSSYYRDYYQSSYRGEVHPWDKPDRRHGSRRRSFRAVHSYRSDPYFRRTETHALHPYYRKHYHDILTVTDTSRSAEIYRQFYVNSFPFVALPSETNCSNYSFYKGHGRFPPKDFKCLRP